MGLFKTDEEKKKDLNQEGVQAYDKGELEKAIKAFQAALKIDPNYTDALLNLGIVYKDQGNYKDDRKTRRGARLRLSSQRTR